MKNKQKFILIFIKTILIIIVVFFFVGTLVSIFVTRNVINHSINIPYSFPIKPGTEEWKAFKSHDEMLNALIIPTETLKHMTSDALITTVLDYPLLGDMLAYNDIQTGFSAVKNGFNGLQELIIRLDAPQKLFEKYSTINPEEFPTNLKTMSSKKVLELILSQKEIFDKLSEEQKNVIKNISTENNITNNDLTISKTNLIAPINLSIGEIINNRSLYIDKQISTKGSIYRADIEAGRITDNSYLNLRDYTNMNNNSLISMKIMSNSIKKLLIDKYKNTNSDWINVEVSGIGRYMYLPMNGTGADSIYIEVNSLTIK